MKKFLVLSLLVVAGVVLPGPEKWVILLACLATIWSLFRERVESGRNADLVRRDLVGELEASRRLHDRRDDLARLYDRIVNLVPVGVYAFREDPDKRGRFLFVSDRFCELLGLVREEVLLDAGTAFARAHPDDLESLRQAHRSALETGNPLRWEGRFVVDGEARWMRLECDGIRHEDGSSSWNGVVIDKTRQHEVELALHESEVRYRELFENTPVPMWIFEQPPSLRFLMVNQAAVDRYGWSREEFARMTLWDVRRPEARAELERVVESNGDAGFHGNLEHVTKSGEVFTVEVTCRRVWMDGRWVRVSALHDITAKLRVEEELRRARDAAEGANRAKSDFLATISHEIRTPMNAVIGMIQMALNGGTGQAQKDRLDKAHGAAKALLSILNDILDFSKIEAGALVLDETEFDPAEVVHGVADLFESLVLSKGLRFEVDCAPELPVRIVGDPLRLRQVLGNLLGNAAKFTSQGRIRLEAFVEKDTGDDAILRFTVRDTGIGISPREAERLFQPFVQAEHGTTRQYGGTGLGLSISRTLVERMGGRIEVDGSPGVGSVFSFTIACRVRQGSAASQVEVGLEKPNPPSGRASRILLVEDNPLNQEVGKGLLEFAGYAVEVAENGQVALDMLAVRPFDLVLMDLHMPVMGGLEATRKLRFVPECAGIPVIALTADMRPGVAEECLAAGMDSFVGKPFDPKALLERIESHLRPK